MIVNFKGKITGVREINVPPRNGKEAMKLREITVASSDFSDMGKFSTFDTHTPIKVDISKDQDIRLDVTQARVLL